MKETKKNQKRSNFIKEYECEGEDPDLCLNMLPPGYRFCPTDEELIVYYLKPKNLKQTLPLNKFRMADIWTYKPQHLIERFKFHREKEWYFFVKRDYWCPKGSGPDRTAGFDGYWIVTEADKEIYSGDQKIGYKTELVFHETIFLERGDGERTNWIMHEYKVDQESCPSTSAAADDIVGAPSTNSAANDIKFMDWFLCKILATAEIENNQQKNEELATEVADESQTSSFKWRVYKENDRIIPYDYLNSFPPGYRFCPTDEELIVHYLRPKNAGEDLFVNKIKNVDVYDNSPDSLTDGMYEQGGENERYFFSWRTIVKYGSNKRVSRAAGDGHWKATGKDEAIYTGHKQIGFKTTLVFHKGKSSRGRKTKWIMYEYKESQADVLVLCVLLNTTPKTVVKNNRKRKIEDTELEPSS